MDAGVLRTEVQPAERVEAPGAQLAPVADLDADRGEQAPLGLHLRRLALGGVEAGDARRRPHAEDQVTGAVDRAQVHLAVGAQHVLARDGVADGTVAQQREHHPLRELGEFVQLGVIDLLLALRPRVAAEHRPAALELIELDDQALLAALVDGGEPGLVRHLVLQHPAQVQRRVESRAGWGEDAYAGEAPRPPARLDDRRRPPFIGPEGGGDAGPRNGIDCSGSMIVTFGPGGRGWGTGGAAGVAVARARPMTRACTRTSAAQRRRCVCWRERRSRRTASRRWQTRAASSWAPCLRAQLCTRHATRVSHAHGARHPWRGPRTVEAATPICQKTVELRSPRPASSGPLAPRSGERVRERGRRARQRARARARQRARRRCNTERQSAGSRR